MSQLRMPCRAKARALARLQAVLFTAHAEAALAAKGRTQNPRLEGARAARPRPFVAHGHTLGPPEGLQTQAGSGAQILEGGSKVRSINNATGCRLQAEPFP